ncbi:uncharacterized protein LOC117332925 [Pecten maximus]|uniref:uncharacterized protein LOC117332925 n=1 Tax=Pecten maximus TaxID=6579 RepID=UPI001458A20A|nr:uncharacterized protein LOC117332925 [Pecten maximus]
MALQLTDNDSIHGHFSSRVISNVALNKPTTQSSTFNASSLAVDGFVDPPTYNRLRNFTVELSKTNTSDVRGHLLDAILCYNFTESPAPGDDVITLPCPRDTTGRFLRISKKVEILDDALTLCEVVVEVSRDECNLADIALNKPATQSSVGYEGAAGRAVDGNLNPDYEARSCTHTHPIDNKPWWQVDLGDVYRINRVSVQNRVKYGYELENFVIETSETNVMGPNGHLKNSKLCYNYTEAQVPSGELKTLPCLTDTFGRYLRITKSLKVLMICEVIVEGD